MIGIGEYETHDWGNAVAKLSADHWREWNDLNDLLQAVYLTRDMIVCGGGAKSQIAKAIEWFLNGRGWLSECRFDCIEHKVDFISNGVAFETEWNNKDTFFDRDLSAFRTLYDAGIIQVGVILTRSTSLRNVFRELGINSKYGSSTTHLGKLIPRVEHGGSGNCPVLAIGITSKQIESEEEAEQRRLSDEAEAKG